MTRYFVYTDGVNMISLKTYFQVSLMTKEKIHLLSFKGILVRWISWPLRTIAVRKRFRQRPILDREAFNELAVKANLDGAILAVIHGSFAEIGVRSEERRVVEGGRCRWSP